MADTTSGFQYTTVSFDSETIPPREVPPSQFSEVPVIEYAQLIGLSDGEGTILYYPKRHNSEVGVVLDVGDVLFLREGTPIETQERQTQEEGGGSQTEAQTLVENGVIVQIIAKSTARYPQSDVKALFRLTTGIRAKILERSHNEPIEVMDEFLSADFKVRASIVNGEWHPAEGRVVSRNVDIFFLSPRLLASNILVSEPDLNVNLGDYKEQAVEFFAGGFDKINLITGMKGAGKSHIAKGIIHESLNAGMSAIVFDINNEYHRLPNSATFWPTDNLKFRLDRIPPRALFDMIQRIAPFADRTGQIAQSQLPDIIQARRNDANHVPDIAFLRDQANNIITARGEMGTNMRASYTNSLNAVESYNLLMTEEEALAETEFIRQSQRGEQATPPAIGSLSSVLFNLEHTQQPGVIIFSIGGLLPFIQKIVVDLVIETLKSICDRQTQAHERAKEQGESHIPIYPTIYFEEAHMYMEARVIDELIPLIRHYGMNLFFITNTPGALPDSVFRLIDNLIMTQMLNKKDIDQVKHCGLTDTETIEGFARDLPKHHALFLSAIAGATNNFPLVFNVRDFGLPQTGVTRSMWKALKEHNQQAASSEGP